jgi:hypothetical protein
MKITMRERMRRVGVLMNLATDDAEAQARFGAFLQGLQEFNSAGLSAAMSFRVELSRIGLSDAEQIERSVAAFARTSNGGLIVSRTSEAIAHRALIIALAARHRLPAVYPLRLFVNDGGLLC